MKIVFRNDIIENSTKSIYKKDTFEQLFLKIINSLNFYHYFPNLNQCEKFVKQLMSESAYDRINGKNIITLKKQFE